MARAWMRRGLGIGLCLAIGAGAWAATNWSSLQTRYAIYKLKAATDEAERAKWAEAVAARDGGARELIAMCRDDRPEVRAVTVTAIAKHLEALPPNDTHGVDLGVALIDEFGSASEAERESLAPLLPMLVQRVGGAFGPKCRAAVTTAFQLKSAEARIAAIRAALHPQVGLRAEVVPFLGAPEPEVRRAALFAVGPATDSEPVIGDEDLFRWLHDPDADARSICRAALVSRGRSDAEISFGKRLVSPDASDRLNLLLDLRYDDELTDAGPWLERLSHDLDPAVRAGAARVFLEINGERMLPIPAWIARLAESDSSPTVRRIAGFHRAPKAMLDPEIRLIEGP